MHHPRVGVGVGVGVGVRVGVHIYIKVFQKLIFSKLSEGFGSYMV